MNHKIRHKKPAYSPEMQSLILQFCLDSDVTLYRSVMGFVSRGHTAQRVMLLLKNPLPLCVSMGRRLQLQRR